MARVLRCLCAACIRWMGKQTRARTYTRLGAWAWEIYKWKSLSNIRFTEANYCMHGRFSSVFQRLESRSSLHFADGVDFHDECILIDGVVILCAISICFFIFQKYSQRIYARETQLFHIWIIYEFCHRRNQNAVNTGATWLLCPAPTQWTRIRTNYAPKTKKKYQKIYDRNMFSEQHRPRKFRSASGLCVCKVNAIFRSTWTINGMPMIFKFFGHIS